MWFSWCSRSDNDRGGAEDRRRRRLDLGGGLMPLSLEDVDRFFRLHRGLMFFVNQKLKVIDKKVATPEAYSGLPPETRIKVHKVLLEHMELIDAFADENPFRFP